jgi:hypothetical protein
MENKIKAYKRKFDRELKHVKLILMQNKDVMPRARWLQFVHLTKKSIEKHPADFFHDVPEKKILTAALSRVFESFMEDQKIRDVQKGFNGRAATKVTKEV